MLMSSDWESIGGNQAAAPSHPWSLSSCTPKMQNGSAKKRILVTGGSGLVGEGIKWIVENETDSRFAKRADEEWIFLTSKDGDLKYVLFESFKTLLTGSLLTLRKAKTLLKRVLIWQKNKQG